MEEVKQPEQIQQSEPQPQKPVFNFDEEFEAQKKKDIETFKQYGLVTKEDVEAHVKQIVEQQKLEMENLRAEFTAFKEWAMRKKVQGMNSGAVEKPSSPMDRFKPAW